MFGESFHGPLVHEAVRAELAARRRGTASTKTRAEVAMTGAKAWRQKGTGRARVGALSAVAAAPAAAWPSGPSRARYTVKVNRKAVRRALRAALALHAERGSIAGVDASAWDTPSTKAGRGRAGHARRPGPRAAWCSARARRTAPSPSATSRGVSVLDADQVGVADVIGAARLVVSEAALERLAAKARSSTRGEEAA